MALNGAGVSLSGPGLGTKPDRLGDDILRPAIEGEKDAPEILAKHS
jgi:hypothetical protein